MHFWSTDPHQTGFSSQEDSATASNSAYLGILFDDANKLLLFELCIAHVSQSSQNGSDYFGDARLESFDIDSVRRNDTVTIPVKQIKHLYEPSVFD